jgi:putative IMPACT (imprinted ancient) family translation regulator
VGGLIQAYTQTAQETVKHAPLLQKEIFDEIVFTFTYEQTSLITSLLQKYEGKIMEEHYDQQIQQKLQINRGWSEAFKHELFERSKGTLIL